MILEEQERILKNNKKNMLVSASAGSGKTYIMIKYISQLICQHKVPVNQLLVLTFTKAAATQLKERLLKRLKEQETEQFILEQIDALSIANISTIHSFCEKYLKKYANILDLSDNFSIMDENLSQKLKEAAFEKTLKIFQSCDVEAYYTLMTAFKNEKQKIKRVVFEIENLSSAVANKTEFLEKNLFKSEYLFDAAMEFLFSNAKLVIQEQLLEISKLHVEDFEMKLKSLLNDFMKSENLIEMSKILQNFVFPYLPKRKEVGNEVVEMLQVIKQEILSVFTKIQELNLEDEENLSAQRNGQLEKLLIKFFNLYEQQEESLKKAQNCLDFCDLEKYMNLLSEKEKLFEGFKFVFVDEYQDTNKIQERIIKNVAKNCNFVAVGDVKQGIYGFRLASSEIFLKDLRDFQDAEDSTVNFLQSNFRSNQKVLGFVNDVFKVCMTSAVCGIDYEKTSMLKGVGEFLEENSSAVHIDLIEPIADEGDEIPEVYSVKNATLCCGSGSQVSLNAIKKRILEVLSSEISDNGVMRKCKFSDIAILSRKRDALFNDLENFLQQCEIPVISNSRNMLLQEPEILVLVNYLKLALVLDDEVALLSVLLSGLYRMNANEIAALKKDENLCEVVKNEEAFKTFMEDLETFKFNMQVFGLKKAFEELFLKTGFKAYLNMKTNRLKLNAFVDKFLEEVLQFNFDLPALVHYLQTVEISVSPEVSVAEDAVLLTTIHNSKGLEYPIVFLIGCDQSLSKSRPKVDLEIDENFGLAVKVFDTNANKEQMTVRMRAIQENQAQKNFVEELMIFYVALTRAKNRLYLFGQFKESLFEKFSLKKCDSYFDFIFFAHPKVKKTFLEESLYKDEILQVEKVDDVTPQEFGEKQNLRNVEISPEILKKIQKYLNFTYKIDEKLNFRLKESVTSLNQKNQEEELVRFNNDNFNFSSNMQEIGNAYHFALKAIDFQKVSDLDTLKFEIEKNKDCFNQELIDFQILLQNILLLKNLVQDGKIYKEKEFILKDQICNLVESDLQDEILVQGVIDLFVVKKDEIVLVDYKYSNSNNEEYLINKYKNQLKLYKIALEKATKLKINQIYLLSLKNSKLISINI